jgi:DNA polymerase I
MSVLSRLPFREIWACDFEFSAPDGERPAPRCVVAVELKSGRETKLWADELARLSEAPFSTGPDTLFVAYYASAELGCFLALGWPLPTRILDLYAEFRVETNGLPLPCGRGLLGALQFYQLEHIDADDKGEMRQLAMRRADYSAAERKALIEYCASDVVALRQLLPKMLPSILARRGGSSVALGQALLRGRYMAAAARIEHTGIPIDVVSLASIRAHWAGLKGHLIREVDSRYGVYEGLTFKAARFADYLAATRIPWPRLPSGALALDDDTFRDQAKSWPQLQGLRELRHALSELRLERPAIGSDARNRCLLSAFSSRTGRNQPSNAKFLFGPAVWIRSLIRPERGRALAYVDFSSQEMGIAAALSGDALLLDAYRTGDIYLAFAKQAGLAPSDATKASHAEVRDRCKAVVLGTLYGMGPETLARRIGRPLIEARDLLRLHQTTYRRFWDWSDNVVASAILAGSISTVFGWRLRVVADFNPRSVGNFSMQANGAEMLRLACCLATEAGINVCAPVHDAVLIEAPVERIDQDVALLQSLMASASSTVLGGVLALGSDAKIVRWPGRYSDARGRLMWDTVMKLVAEVEAEGAADAA